MLEHSGLIGSILRKGEEIRKLQEEGIPQLDLQLHVDEWQNLKVLPHACNIVNAVQTHVFDCCSCSSRI
jgi:hypothetical protein